MTDSPPRHNDQTPTASGNLQSDDSCVLDLTTTVFTSASVCSPVTIAAFWWIWRITESLKSNRGLRFELEMAGRSSEGSSPHAKALSSSQPAAGSVRPWRGIFGQPGHCPPASCEPVSAFDPEPTTLIRMLTSSARRCAMCPNRSFRSAVPMAHGPHPQPRAY